MPHELSLSFLLFLQWTHLHKILKICLFLLLCEADSNLFAINTTRNSFCVFWGLKNNSFCPFRGSIFPDRAFRGLYQEFWVSFLAPSPFFFLLTSSFSPRFAVVRVCKCTFAWCLVPLQNIKYQAYSDSAESLVLGFWLIQLWVVPSTLGFSTSRRKLGFVYSLRCLHLFSEQQ